MNKRKETTMLPPIPNPPKRDKDSPVILSMGAGVDSSCIGLVHLFERDLGIEHVIMADTGAEKRETIANAQMFKTLFEMAGIPFTIVKREGENIIEWVTRLGSVMLLPGSSHVCSMKFKAEVIQKFVKNAYPGLSPTYLIGIEANEERRRKRFTKPRCDNAAYEYPLMDWQWTREHCDTFLRSHGLKITKSSCQPCPYMSTEELADARLAKEDWATIELVENRFKETSPIKHQNWLDQGKPLKSNGTCFAGHWRKDSWKEGARLFAAKHNGKQCSVDEWAALIDSGEIKGSATDDFKMDREAVLEKARMVIRARIKNGLLIPPSPRKITGQQELFAIDTHKAA